MPALQRTVFNEKHKGLGAIMVDCNGWQMPGHYPGGDVREHLCVRYHAGLFDDSHKGKFHITGSTALYFLQHVLTNNAEALSDGQSQYTIIQNEAGSALDDALLFRLEADRYLLCVNAVNREHAWNHLHREAENFRDLYIEDRTFELAMLCLRGPGAGRIIDQVLENPLPEHKKEGHAGTALIAGTRVTPMETADHSLPGRVDLFMDKQEALPVWDLLSDNGAEPVGIEAQETLRLESAMPLFGHELGLDPENAPIPIFASSFAPAVVSFSLKKGDFVGKDALVEQFRAYERIAAHDCSDIAALPRMIYPVAVKDEKSADRGDEVHRNGKRIGVVTTGAMVPLQSGDLPDTDSLCSPGGKKYSAALALLDSETLPGERIQIRIHNRFTDAIVVPFGRKPDSGVCFSSVLWDSGISAGTRTTSKSTTANPTSH